MIKWLEKLKIKTQKIKNKGKIIQIKTIREWSEIYGIEVVDPDGFDRNDILLEERLFTQEDFIKGLVRSSIVPNKRKNKQGE